MSEKKDKKQTTTIDMTNYQQSGLYLIRKRTGMPNTALLQQALDEFITNNLTDIERERLNNQTGRPYDSVF